MKPSRRFHTTLASADALCARLREHFAQRRARRILSRLPRDREYDPLQLPHTVKVRSQRPASSIQ